MRHWNFFPCLFALLAVFWWKYVDLRIEVEAKGLISQEPKFEPSIFDGPFDLKAPPLVLPPINEKEGFDPLGQNGTETPKVENKETI